MTQANTYRFLITKNFSTQAIFMTLLIGVGYVVDLTQIRFFATANPNLSFVFISDSVPNPVFFTTNSNMVKPGFINPKIEPFLLSENPLLSINSTDFPVIKRSLSKFFMRL